MKFREAYVDFSQSNSLHFLVINLEESTERLNNITKILKNLNCDYTLIPAVDGKNMENDAFCKEMLQPRFNLLNTEFVCEGNSSWIYDGTIEKSFPHLILGGQKGTKALTMSNIKAYKVALKMNYKWFCILEDDADFGITEFQQILNFINEPENKDIDVVLLDKRHNGWGGTCGMLYNKKILNTLIEDMHPMSKFSIENKYVFVNSMNIWDWKLFKYLQNVNRNFMNLPIMDSGRFKSTLNEKFCLGIC